MSLTKIVGAVVLAVVTTSVASNHAVAASPLRITDINVKGVRATGANTLVATLDLTGQLVGQAFTLHNVQLPVTLRLTPDPADPPCQILNLSLEIEYLNLLGLVVELNDCDEEPITLDVFGDPEGGLLGQLLCGLLGGLDIGLIDLSDLLENPLALADIQALLNEFFDKLLAQAGPPTDQGQNQASPNACEVLTLHLGPINLDLLGLNVATSEICLFVYAEPNQGLLGNLLCGLTDLLNGGRANQRALDALATQIIRVITRLGL